MPVVTTTLSEKQLEIVDQFTRQLGLSRSGAIRHFVCNAKMYEDLKNLLAQKQISYDTRNIP